MKDFCIDCGHYSIQDNLKKLYNRYVFDDFFTNCPLNLKEDNGGFFGCTRKHTAIEWEGFNKWLEENGVIASSTS